jgi:hypothetical protein
MAVRWNRQTSPWPRGSANGSTGIWIRGIIQDERRTLSVFDPSLHLRSKSRFSLCFRFSNPIIRCHTPSDNQRNSPLHLKRKLSLLGVMSSSHHIVILLLTSISWFGRVIFVGIQSQSQKGRPENGTGEGSSCAWVLLWAKGVDTTSCNNMLLEWFVNLWIATSRTSPSTNFFVTLTIAPHFEWKSSVRFLSLNKDNSILLWSRNHRNHATTRSGNNSKA